jgi:hypothetical protein
MRRFCVTGIGAAALVAMLSLPAKAELLVTISKSQQRVAVVVDGAETYRWPVSSGRRGFETPTGSFHPTRLERHWYSRQYENSPMPWSMFFFRGYAMHGTVEVYNLGNAASHGCVRLRPDNAQVLYSLVRKHGFANTTIIVMKGPLPAAPGAVPMADAEPPQADAAPEQAFAKAYRETDRRDDRSSRNSGTRREDEKGDIDTRDEPRLAHAGTFMSRGSEVEVLRGREAWLRSLDRKYGITR